RQQRHKEESRQRNKSQQVEASRESRREPPLTGAAEAAAITFEKSLKRRRSASSTERSQPAVASNLSEIILEGNLTDDGEHRDGSFGSEVGEDEEVPTLKNSSDQRDALSWI
uniref:RNF220 domain-containing protein n=1 Tax=Macrostomum lignano TaxID=282301 RepID=A0A1I8FKI7_9PLAT